MKKLLIALLLLPSIAWGGDLQIARMSHLMLGGGVSAAWTCPYTLCETFEAAGYDLGACGSAPCWTETLNNGSVDEDYATSPAPLSGAQSLLVDEGGTGVPETVLTLATPMANVFMKLRLYSTKLATGTQDIVKLYGTTSTACDTLLVSFSADASEHWSVDSIDSDISALWVDATTFNGYLWFEYEKGSSNNGVGRIFAAATDSKPETADVTKSTLAEELDVVCIKLLVTDADAAINIFDDVYIDDAAIP